MYRIRKSNIIYAEERWNSFYGVTRRQRRVHRIVLANLQRRGRSRPSLWRLPEHTRIIVSPTKRTQQTAIALDNEFETIADIGPGASAESVLTVAGWPKAKDAVLVVGHQPTLGEVASLLMSGVPEGWSMRKSAVWWFSNTKKGLSTDLVLRTVISPDML